MASAWKAQNTRCKVFVRGKTTSTDGKKHGSYRFISSNMKDSVTGKELDWRKYGVFPFTDYLDDPDDINAFHEFSFEFYGHANAFPFLRLTVGAGGPFEGTVYYDDLRVYQCGVDAHINLSAPQMSAFKGGDTNFRFCGVCPGTPQVCLMVQLLKAEEPLYETVLSQSKDGFFSGNIPAGLPAGEYLLRTTLVDIPGKLRMKTTDFPVTIRPLDEIPPLGAVSFDENRRLLVDGKPFFGVSLGCSSPSNDAHLKEHADEGFNVVDTGPFNMVPYTEENFQAKLLSKLDYIHSLGMKVRLCLIDFYSRPYLCKAFSTAGPEGVEKIVTLIKDHPAILGYYLLDELTEKDWPTVTELRNVCNRVDPYHPCYIVTNLLSTTPKIAVTTDVIGYDYYPIGLKGKPITNCSNVDIMAQKSKATGLPFWAVPQAFSWALYTADMTPEKYLTYDCPSVNQMFADAVLFAINGVTDYWFFTCPVRGDHRKIVESVNDPGYIQRMFHDTGTMARHLNRLGEYILDDITPEDIPFLNQGVSGIRVKHYRDAQGKSAVVVFAEGQGAARATFMLPEGTWHSDFGLTQQLPDGTWIFQANGFAADVLYEE